MTDTDGSWETPHPSSVTDGMGGPTPPSVTKKNPSGPSLAIKMSVPETEGGQDHDDILGFPGDGFEDPQDGVPPETMGADLDSGDAPMTEEEAGSPSSDKKRKKSAPVPPDEFVGDRIKLLKTRITGLKSADNAWTQTLRGNLDPDTVNGKLGGDRTFKTNQQ